PQVDLADGEALRALHVELRRLAVVPLPRAVLRRRELLYGGPVLVGHLVDDGFPALEDAVDDLRPERVHVERLGQELADVRDAAAHRLVPLRLDLAGDRKSTRLNSNHVKISYA